VWCEDCERTIDNFDALMTTIRLGLAAVPTIWRPLLAARCAPFIEDRQIGLSLGSDIFSPFARRNGRTWETPSKRHRLSVHVPGVQYALSDRMNPCEILFRLRACLHVNPDFPLYGFG
jgi:hypothetical protein